MFSWRDGCAKCVFSQNGIFAANWLLLWWIKRNRFWVYGDNRCFNWILRSSSSNVRSWSSEKWNFKWILTSTLIWSWSDLLQHVKSYICSGWAKAKKQLRLQNQITFFHSLSIENSQVSCASLFPFRFHVLLLHSAQPFGLFLFLSSPQETFFTAFSSTLCFALRPSFFRVYHTTPFHNSIQFLFRRETTIIESQSVKIFTQ